MARLLALPLLLGFLYVPSAHAQSLTVCALNCEWFFDEDVSNDDSNIGPSMAAPDGGEYQSRVAGFGVGINAIKPDIMALSEIENEKVVQDIATELSTKHGLSYDVAFVQGQDTHTGQDVAFLVKDGLTFQPKRFSFSTLTGDPNFKDLSKHLAIRVDLGQRTLTLVAIHLNTRPDQRMRQARTLRSWTQMLALHDDLIVLGDTNSKVRFNETTPDSDIGVMRDFGSASTLDDLFDCHQMLSGQARRTHVGGGELDRILTSKGISVQSVENRRDLIVRGQPDQGSGVNYGLPESEQDLSDHYPLVAKITLSTGPSPLLARRNEVAVGGMPSELEDQLRALEQRIAELEERLAELGRRREP